MKTCWLGEVGGMGCEVGFETFVYILNVLSLQLYNMIKMINTVVYCTFCNVFFLLSSSSSYEGQPTGTMCEIMN